MNAQGQERDDDLRPRMMDWLARCVAVAMMKLPRVAPSRWRQRANARRGEDLRREPFTVRTCDGQTLQAAFVTAAAQPHPATLPILFAHGWTETKEFHHRLARLLASRGYNVIQFDHRAHGRSTGRHCTFGVRESRDVGAVIDEAARRGWIGDRLISMGVSMGAASVLMHAPTDPRIAGVVAYAPFVDFMAAVDSYRRRYCRRIGRGMARRGFIQAAIRRGFDLRDAAPVAAAARTDAPVLFIVGDRDVNLPCAEHAARLVEARAGRPSELVIVPQADHFNICMRQWPAADEAMLRFCESVCRAEPVTPQSEACADSSGGASINSSA